MKKIIRITVGCLIAIILQGIAPLWAQADAESYFTVTGTVRNKDSKRKLENVNGLHSRHQYRNRHQCRRSVFSEDKRSGYGSRT